MLINQILRQRYKIIERIGSGGFGDTYLAIDLDFPGERKSVVKHLSPKNSDPEAVAIAQRLFKTEAECLSRLGEHDCIPRLYSYFEEEGQFYLVQEFIEGDNLVAQFQSGNRWSEEATISFLQELLEILAFVHQEETIHRDIKPANIMRREDDGRLFLIDFGAVKEILTVDEKGQTNLTNLTVGIGSVDYMAPEQAMGKPGKYSDVYAVGMLGIQALTGFISRDLPQDSSRLREVLEQLKINISPQLESVLSKMISFQPQNRFADAVEALEAVRKLSDTFILPDPPVLPEPSDNNLPKKLLLILFGAIALAGAGVYAFQLSQQPNYAQLDKYLQNKQWQQADQESDRLLLKIAGEDGALDAKSIANFPCQALSKIDQLWTDNSEGRFGFTPQKQVYLETGNKIGRYTESTYEAFGDRVDWRPFNSSWSLYGDLKFTDIAEVGHLPSPGKVAADQPILRWQERWMLLSRFDKCGF
ncbi:MAG: GUN4 domain-containing protein [Xenococcus sp. (in: cyanobacteria)]